MFCGIVIDKLDGYTVTWAKLGGVLITRTSDRHSVFLQGDDATSFREEFDNMAAINKAHEMCQEYDHVMTPERSE